jgi:ankyrin repeat protein
LHFDLSRLPSEILGDYIFKYFSFGYWLQSLTLVNKQWYNAAIQSSADKQLLVNTLSPQNMFKFFTIASIYKISTLALTGVPVSKARLTALLHSSPRLNTFVQFKAGGRLPSYDNLTFGFIKTAFIESNLMDMFPNATRVQFSEEKVKWTSKKVFPNVSELAIQNCSHLGQLLKSFPSLKVLHIPTLAGHTVPKSIQVCISSTGDKDWRKNYSYDQIWASRIFKTPLMDTIDTQTTRANQLQGLAKYTSVEYELSLQERRNEYKFPAVSHHASNIFPQRSISFPELAVRLKANAQWLLLFYYKHFPAADALAMILHVDDKDNIESYLRENSQEIAETITPSVFISLVETFEASTLHEIFTKDQLRRMFSATDKTGSVVFQFIEAESTQYFDELVEEYGPLPDNWLDIENAKKATPIQHALKLGNLEWIEYLLDADAEIDVSKLFGDDDEDLRDVRYDDSTDDDKDITKIQKVVKMIIEKDAATSSDEVNWFFDANWCDLSANEMIRMLNFFVDLLRIDDLNKVKQDNEDSEGYGTSLVNHMIKDWNASTKVFNFAVKKFKIDLNLVADNGMTPMLTAIEEGRIDLIEWLLDNGAELSPAKGLQPLYEAVGNRELDTSVAIELTDIFLARGADINAYTEDEICERTATPLMNAIINGRPVEFIEYLIARGARVDLTDNHGDTVLHNAVHSRPEVIKYLAPRVDINKLNYEGISALDKALIGTRYNECLATLLKCGADVNQPRPGFNMTPLMIACLNSNFTAVQELLKYNVNLRAVDVNGHSFVHYLVKHFKGYATLIFKGLFIDMAVHQY